MFAARQGFQGAAAVTLVANTTITFTSSGNWTAPAGVNSVRILAVGGGGAGGAGWEGGGGGGGGFVDQTFTVVPSTTYTIVIGAGGSGVAVPASNWGNTANGGATYMSTSGTNIVVAMGGGAGGAEIGAPSSNVSRPRSGGSGGGAGAVWHANGVQSYPGNSRGVGTTLQNSTYGYGSGNDGGPGWGQLSGNVDGVRTFDYTFVGGGGGGAGEAGYRWYFTTNPAGNATGLYGGNGGAGLSSDISGNVVYYAGGGGGGFRPGGGSFPNPSGYGSNYVAGTGGIGGGNTSVVQDTNQTGGGTINSGGGGGGVAKRTNTGSTTNSNNGGSGILIISHT